MVGSRDIDFVNVVCVEALGIQSAGLGPVSLTIESGSCTGLTGPSGSGKTRLLRCLADLDCHEGDVSLNGASRESFTPPEWRTQVGLLPAESFWWSERVLDHFPNKQKPELDSLDLSPVVFEQPLRQLSSGQRQRLALLRLLANQPEVLLLDEPTANLDQDNIMRVEALIAAYRNQHRCCVIWVTHDRAQLERVADRSLTMANGRLDGDGS